MRLIITRLIYGMLFAIPMMLVTFAFGYARPAAQTEVTSQEDLPQDLDCKSCHPAFFEAWEGGLHGRAGSDAAFQKAWQDQGQPEECLTCHVSGYDPQTKAWKTAGIACERCHNPIPANHPNEPMPVDQGAALCGNCHTETYFQWQASSHRQKDLPCIICHDPHSNSLKAENKSVLCASCHKARSSNFSHTAHSQKGMACTDCHMADLHQAGVQAHGEKDHSFFVSLTTCNNCHVYQMHDPVAVHVTRPTPTPDPLASVETLSVVATPRPVNPLSFAILAGLVGLAAGIVLAPWIERFRNKIEIRRRGG